MIVICYQKVVFRVHQELDSPATSMYLHEQHKGYHKLVIMKKKHSGKCKPSAYWTFKIMIS